MTGHEGPDLFRPAHEILAEINDALSAPRTPPRPISIGEALTLDVAQTWPCADWCCTLGCPGPGNALCMSVSPEVCPRWCTCGYGHVREVVRTLQLARSDDIADLAALTWHRNRARNCRHPRWWPAWAHCWSCARSTRAPRLPLPTID